MKYTFRNVISTAGHGSNHYGHYGNFDLDEFEAANDKEALEKAQKLQDACDEQLIDCLIADGHTKIEAITCDEYQMAPSFASALCRVMFDPEGEIEYLESVEF